MGLVRQEVNNKSMTRLEHDCTLTKNQLHDKEAHSTQNPFSFTETTTRKNLPPSATMKIYLLKQVLTTKRKCTIPNE